MNPDKLAKWNRWLGDANTDGSIAYELANLSVVREVNAGLREMVVSNPGLQKHSAFYSVSHITYSHAVLMYIRRQVRRDSDSVSLVRLADDIHKNADLFTEKFFAGIYQKERDDSFWEDVGKASVAAKFFGDLKDRLDPAVIARDIKLLESVSDGNSSFTDKRLAHLDKREPDSIPTLSDVENWCEALNEVLENFMLLIRGIDYKVEPILQHDWKSIFRQAWI